MIGVPLQIGSLRLTSNLLLAPIAGWCDLAWRVTCRELARHNGGLGLACTDLLSPKGLLAGSEASLDLARTNDHDQPVGMQLYGSDPRVLADGARWCADHGATVVDINMGCPVDKVCKKDGGSKLMTEPDRAVRIAEAVRSALPGRIPLTAKMRLGWTGDDAARNLAGELACRLADTGVATITVHGRTTEQRFKGQCDHEGIRRVVEAVGERTGAYAPGRPGSGLPVVGNGDVRTPGDAIAMMRATGCAGVMIGRGAFAMPWIFRTAWEAQRRLDQTDSPARTAPDDHADDSLEPSEDEKLDTVLAYFDRMREHRDDRYALHKIRQKISWLGKTINASHCRPLKEGIRAAASPEDVYAAVASWRESRRREPDPMASAMPGPGGPPLAAAS